MITTNKGDLMVIEKEYDLIVEKNKDPKSWFYIDYFIHHYDGCLNKCIFCPLNKKKDYNILIPKSLGKLENFLMTHSNQKVMGFYPSGDPYQVLEKKYNLTSKILSLLEQYQYPVCIITKSDLILKDLEKLISMNNNSKVFVLFEFSTVDPILAKKLEPNAVSPIKRFEAMKTLNRYGIPTGIYFNPILPFLCDNTTNVKKLLKLGKESGARFVFPIFGVTLEKGQREYFYHKLEKEFPDIVKKYSETYKNDYFCYSPNSKKLSKIFKEEALRLGLVSDISYLQKNIVPKEKEQVQLF